MTPCRTVSRTAPSRRGSEGTGRQSMEHYKIRFNYSKRRHETVHVLGRDADDSLNHGLKIRKKKNLKPISIVMHDGVGTFLARISTGLGKARAGVGQVKRGYKAGKLEALIREAQSKDKVKKSIAKAELRKKYPEVYRNLAFKEV